MGITAYQQETRPTIPVNRDYGKGGINMSAYHPFKSAGAKEKYVAHYDACAKEWPVCSECKMVDTSYGQTFVRISGPIDAEPLVSLPGFGLNSLMWMSNIEALSENYRTYAVDNIYDYGRSVYVRKITGPDDFTTWLDEFFSGLGLEKKISLMGLSYGGWIAAKYSLRFPDRLAKVVLLAPAATVLPLSLGFTVRFILLLLLPFRPYIRSFFYWLGEDAVRKVRPVGESGTT